MRCRTGAAEANPDAVPNLGDPLALLGGYRRRKSERAEITDGGMSGDRSEVGNSPERRVAADERRSRGYGRDTDFALSVFSVVSVVVPISDLA